MAYFFKFRVLYVYREMIFMKLKDLIKSRVSNIRFNAKNVDTKLIIDLLDIAVYAPNHKMREPWRFILLEGKEKYAFSHQYLDALNEDVRIKTEPSVSKIFSAPLLVIVVMPKNRNFRDEIEDMEANAALIQNYMLLATEEGLATAWKTPLFSETDLFKEMIGVTSDEIIIGLIMTGYSDERIEAKPRKSAASLTTLYKS